jgi:hypothetical protein
MSDELVEIRILGLPVAVAVEAQEHFAELSREFLHLANADEEVRRDVPGRLLALSEQLRARFAGFTEANAQLLDDAAVDQLDSIDLTYRLPAEVGPAAEQLGELLDLADRYCESGEYLLTLTTPPRALAYRTWYLQQFIGQCAGERPESYADWESRQGPAVS